MELEMRLIDATNPVDQNRKRELELRFAEAESAKQNAQQQRDQLAERDSQLRTEHDRLGEERVGHQRSHCCGPSQD